MRDVVDVACWVVRYGACYRWKRGMRYGAMGAEQADNGVNAVDEAD